MVQKDKVTEQDKKLYEVRRWTHEKLNQSDDRLVRDTLFGVMQNIDLAMIGLEKFEYLTGDRPNYEG